MAEPTTRERPAHGLDPDRVAAKVSVTLARMLKRDPRGFEAHTRMLDADLGLDSTSMLELLLDLEAEFGVELDPRALEQRDFETVGSLSAFVAVRAIGGPPCT